MQVITQKNWPEGLKLLPQYFAAEAQRTLIDAVKEAVRTAPFYQPCMPRTGQPTSVVMTNFGPLGWVTDKDRGYRYEPTHPVTGAPWPPMPEVLRELWDKVADYPAPPEACLVNWYREDNRMGLHVDWDEQATDAAVVSVSLGDPALFRIGGPERRSPTSSFWVESGDVVVLGGASRRCYHGVDRIKYDQSPLVPKGGRINLTLRRVSLPNG